MSSILLVDDEPQQLTLREMLLSRAGYSISTASTVPDALAALAANPPGILLMDLRLPLVENGLGLIRAANAMPQAPAIVLLSGWPADIFGTPEEAMVAQILTKPVRTTVLMEILDRLARSQ